MDHSIAYNNTDVKNLMYMYAYVCNNQLTRSVYIFTLHDNIQKKVSWIIMLFTLKSCNHEQTTSNKFKTTNASGWFTLPSSNGIYSLSSQRI